MRENRIVPFTMLGLLSLCSSAFCDQFRTDINPALLYYQAFLSDPNLEQADRDYVTDWRGWKLPEKFGRIVTNYDSQLNLLRRAAHAAVPCDWGIDMSAGPTAAMLPHLARAKALVQTARLRAMWDLRQGRQTDACDELLAALALGRNLSINGTVISVLVQIAIEAIVSSAVAENFGQFSPEALLRLAEGLDGPPSRGTVAPCIPKEKTSFHDWVVNRILELQKQNPGNDSKVMEAIHEFIVPKTPNVADSENDSWERLNKAARGTSEGVLNLLRDREGMYTSLEQLMGFPYPEYQGQVKEFTEKSQNSANPFISGTASSLMRARSREFRILATLEMVHAAVEYKLHGEAGLQKVKDPCGQGPFAFRRFVFEGVDRGFELRSAYNLDGDDSAALIFVEKDGPPFRVNGPQIGKPLANESAEEAFRRRYGIQLPK